jgi:hypothetical protein
MRSPTVLVEAVEVMVDEETTTENHETTTTFNSLESKINSLLQDSVGGTPSVDMTATSNNVRSELTVDLELAWSYSEFVELFLDLNELTSSGDGLEGGILQYINALVPGKAEAQILVDAEIVFRLGVGLEFDRKLKVTRPYIKGTTGLYVSFKTAATASYEAMIGPLRGNIDAQVSVTGMQDYDPLSLSVGLDNDVNYYLGLDAPGRAGFQRVDGVLALIKEVGLSFDGRLQADISAGIPLLFSSATIELDIDLDNWLRGNGGFYFNHSVVASSIELPSLLDILLLEPENIIDALDDMVQTAEDAALGEDGAVTKLEVPFASNSVGQSLGGGSDNNVLGKGRRTIVSNMQGELADFEGDKVR